MDSHDIQAMLLVASVFVCVMALIAMAVPRGERRPRQEIEKLRAQISAQQSKLDGLNHDLYRMQGLVELMRPDYRRHHRLRQAIADMKRVWLGASTEAEREKVLRENLWVLAPEYRSIRLFKTTGEKKGLSLSARTGGDDPVHLLVDLKPQSEVTRAALEDAHTHAFSLMQRGELAGQRIECLVIGPSVAEGPGDIKLSLGRSAEGAIRVRALSYPDLIARAELFANPPLDPPEAQIVSLAKARAARAAA